MLTGLVHGVGKLYILTRSQRHPALFADQEMYQHIVNDWHGSIAKVLLENWRMAEEIVAAVHSHADDARQTARCRRGAGRCARSGADAGPVQAAARDFSASASAGSRQPRAWN